MAGLECAAIRILAEIGSKTRKGMQGGNIPNCIDSNLFNLWSFDSADSRRNNADGHVIKHKQAFHPS